MPSPAFQFYPDDFVGSGIVQAAEADEIGAYILLLCLDWGEDGFAFDERRLAKVCRLSLRRFREVWSHIGEKFPSEVSDGRHRNPRLKKERAKQAEWRAKSKRGGQLSAQKRAEEVNHPSPNGPKGGSRVVEPQHQPSGNTPVSSLQSPSPLHTTTTPRPAETAPDVGKSAERGGWPAAVAEQWTRSVGVIQPGRVGRDLAPFVRLYPSGLDALAACVRAVTEYAEHCRRNDAVPKWAQFVSDIRRHVPRTMLPPAAGAAA